MHSSHSQIAYVFSAEGAYSFLAWGNAPGPLLAMNRAFSALISMGSILRAVPQAGNEFASSTLNTCQVQLGNHRKNRVGRLLCTSSRLTLRFGVGWGQPEGWPRSLRRNSPKSRSSLLSFDSSLQDPKSNKNFKSSNSATRRKLPSILKYSDQRTPRGRQSWVCATMEIINRK